MEGNEPEFEMYRDPFRMLTLLIDLGTRIEWYRTFGRDIHCNKDLTRSEYNRMFVDCMASVYQF